MNYLKLITILAVIGVTVVKGQQSDDDVDDIIGSIFNLTNNNGNTNTNSGDVVEEPKNIICVPYNLCDGETNKVITNGSTDGAFLIDIRFGEQKCEHYLEVPCEAPDGYLVPTSTQNPTVTSRPPTPIPTTPPPRCGTRNIKGVGLEVTGITDEAQFGEFPWMVAVLKKDWVPSTKDTLAQCGGSIIHPQVILTGAHCVSGHTANELKVRAGEWDTQTTREALPYQEVDVERIISHEKFNKINLINDMALVILKTPLQLDRHISTVCLPKQNQLFNQDNCIATGWGKDVFGIEGKYQVILKRIELPMVDNQQCQRALRTTRLGGGFKLDPSFVCAGGIAGKDTCLGDGGSPLVCPSNNGQYEQAGIVAWGIGCGEDGIPGVYGNVAAFRNWIDGHMSRLGYGTSSYEN